MNSVATPRRAAKRMGAVHAALMVFALGLAGCGQKGPLMPANPAAPAAPAASAAR